MRTVTLTFSPTLAVLFLTIFISAGDSRAAASFSGDIVQFLNDNPHLVVQTFDRGNVATGQIQGCDTPVDSESNDACFTPGEILPGIAFSTDPDFGGTLLDGPFLFSNLNAVKVLAPDGSAQKSVITFPGNVVNAVGLNIGCLFDEGFEKPCTGETMLVQVYGAGDTLLGQTLVPVNSTFSTFVGITSDQQIEKITFIDSDLETQPSFNGVAKVYFPNAAVRNIPALSGYGASALAIALGLCAAYAVRRRRAARA